MYMGETGHNPSLDWYRQIRESMERNNIGWTFWPYKLPGSACWNGFAYPEGWKETISNFAEGDRSSYAAIQKNRPDRAKALELMRKYVENCRFENCRAEEGYIKAVGLKVPSAR
jgi:hypothetical protein